MSPTDWVSLNLNIGADGEIANKQFHFTYLGLRYTSFGSECNCKFVKLRVIPMLIDR
jgi:hypothetical protein